MTQISFNIPTVWEAKKCVAPPKEISLDIRDESPPDTQFDFDSFFNGKQGEITLGDSINSERKNCQNKNTSFHPSQSSVFACDKRLDNQPRESNTGESDVKLFNLINTSDTPTSDPKSLDFPFTSQPDNSHSMKLKDFSEIKVDKDFSDILSSISIEEHVTPVCKANLDFVKVPEFLNLDDGLTKSSVAEDKNVNVSSESNYNLSDILSSICINDCDESSPKRLNHFPSQSSDESLHLGDFNVVEDKCHGHIYGLNSDFETSIVKEDADDFIKFKSLSLSFGDAERDETSLAALAQSHFLSNDPSENLLTMNQVSTDETIINNTRQSNSNSDQEDSISMLDLFNSLKSSEEATESNSFLSHEIQKKENSTLQGFNVDEDDQIMVAVDLRTCIKSTEDKSCSKPILLPKEDCVDILEEARPQSPHRHIFNNNLSIFFPFGNSNITQVSRGNLKQSLFAKALSCKPKKDPTLLLKAASIKSELFNKMINRTVHLKSNSNNLQRTSATYSDKCVIEYPCRLSFGPSGDCELQ